MTVGSFQEVHIENTNSCRYKCVMCPRDRHSRRLGFMSLEDFTQVLDRIEGFSGNFHLHGFGESLLDRQFISKLEILKQRFPKSKALVFSTLGVKVSEEYFDMLARAGLDTMIVSFYGFSREEYQKIHGFDGFVLARRNLLLLSQARKQVPNSLQVYIKVPGKKVMSTLPIAYASERTLFCKWAQELGFEIREWAYVHNYSNGREYNRPEPQRLCPVIQGYRKKILNITWDLQVIPCCYDFNATISFGNLRAQSLEEIFSSEEYLSFLTAHANQDLAMYPICQQCEKIDYLS